MHEQPDLHWLPIEPSPEAIAWARRMEAVRQGYLQAFAISPERLEEMLAEMNTNRAYCQHQPLTKPPSLN